MTRADRTCRRRGTGQPGTKTPETETRGILAADLELCLRVLAQADKLAAEHPDAVAIRRATARVFKSVKEKRRAERRDKVLANDRAITALTATGAPERIDDETQGLQLVTNATGALAGRLLQPRSCYTCKARYVDVDAFYHQLCPPCAALNRSKRDARTDLSGRRALLTGGRAKIGMYIALRLLRDGAHTTITTRFPTDAIRRFTAMEDSADWIHRLRIVGIDLRDPAQVVALADSVAARGPLDILINNAAQTVRRSPGSYAHLVEAEADPLPHGPLPEMITFDHVSDAHPTSLAGTLKAHPSAHTTAPHTLTALALRAGSATPARVAAGTAIDAGGLLPDLHGVNSWTQHVHEVDPLELLEVPAVQLDGPVHPDQPSASLNGSLHGSAQVRRQRLGDGGPVQPQLQGPRSSAHQYGQGCAQHAHANQRPGDV